MGHKFMPRVCDSLGDPITREKLTQFTEGDLHANLIRLVEALHHYGVITINSKHYKFLYNEYQKYLDNPKDNDAFKNIVGALEHYINITDSNIVTRLIGDVVSDRTGSDVFSLKLIHKLVESNKDIRIMLSNHDINFVLAMHHAKDFNEFKTRIEESRFVNHETQGASLVNLKQDIEDGRISFDEVQNLSESYFKTLTLLDFSIDETSKTFTIYSHAPINFEILEKLADQWGLKFPEQPCNIQEMRAFIDQVNVQCKLILRDGDLDLIQLLFNPNTKVASSQVLWNRETDAGFEFENVKRSKDGYSYHFKYGHDQSNSSRPEHYKTLDNVAGKGYLGNLNKDYTSIGNSDAVFQVATPTISDKIGFNYQQFQASAKKETLIKEYITNPKLSIKSGPGDLKSSFCHFYTDVQNKTKEARRAAKENQPNNFTTLSNFLDTLAEFKSEIESNERLDPTLLKKFEKYITKYAQIITTPPVEDAKVTPSSKTPSPSSKTPSPSKEVPEAVNSEKGPADVSRSPAEILQELIKILKIGFGQTTEFRSFLEGLNSSKNISFISEHFKTHKFEEDTIKRALHLLDGLKLDKNNTDTIKKYLNDQLPPMKGPSTTAKVMGVLNTSPAISPTSLTKPAPAVNPEKGPADVSRSPAEILQELKKILIIGGQFSKLQDFLQGNNDRKNVSFIADHFKTHKFDEDTIKTALHLLDGLKLDKNNTDTIKKYLNDQLPPMKGPSTTAKVMGVLNTSPAISPTSLTKPAPAVNPEKGPADASSSEAKILRQLKSILNLEFEKFDIFKEFLQGNGNNQIVSSINNHFKTQKFDEDTINTALNLLDGLNLDKKNIGFIKTLLIEKLYPVKATTPMHILNGSARGPLNPPNNSSSRTPASSNLVFNNLIPLLKLNHEATQKFRDFLIYNHDTDHTMYISNHIKLNSYDLQTIRQAVDYLRNSNFDQQKVGFITQCLKEKLNYYDKIRSMYETFSGTANDKLDKDEEKTFRGKNN